MKAPTKEKTRLIASLALALAIGGAVWKYHGAREIQTAVGRLKIEREELARRQLWLEQKVDEAEAGNLALQRSSSDLIAAQPTASPSPPPVAPAKVFDLGLFLAAHPEMTGAYRKSAAADALSHYAPLLSELRLPADQIERFNATLAQYELKRQELSTTARAQGWLPGDPRPLALRQEADATRSTELRSLLGESDYRRYEDYEKSLPVRTVVNELAEHLYDTDTPLDAAKANQLTEVLARHALNPKGKIARSALDWNAALAEAGPLLGSEQIAQLQAMRDIADLLRERDRLLQLNKPAAPGH